MANVLQLLNQFFDFILHIDKYLSEIIQNYGTGAYALLFLIIFCETGLVVAPFLPGDSLLFAAGVFASQDILNPWFLFVLLSIAAVLGDTVNYLVGHHFGRKIFSEDAKFLKKEYLEMTEKFYERHGKKTIMLARFLPIIRTFAPFVAGMGRMNYFQFLLYNVSGGLTWIAVFVFGGYFFGNIPFVKNNFTFVVLAIIFLSITYAVFEVWKEHRRLKHEQKQQIK